MIEWPGENWYLGSEGHVQSVEVIEPRPRRSKKKRKQQKVKKVAFGFSRALPKQKGKRR